MKKNIFLLNFFLSGQALDIKMCGAVEESETQKQVVSVKESGRVDKCIVVAGCPFSI